MVPGLTCVVQLHSQALSMPRRAAGTESPWMGSHLPDSQDGELYPPMNAAAGRVAVNARRQWKRQASASTGRPHRAAGDPPLQAAVLWTYVAHPPVSAPSKLCWGCGFVDGWNLQQGSGRDGLLPWRQNNE
ncbi:hypothetical protein ACJZ2D_005738 [Fusarium nematophilum]